MSTASIETLKDVASVEVSPDRLPSATHEEILNGLTTDIYFIRTRDLLDHMGLLNTPVVAEVFARRPRVGGGAPPPPQRHFRRRGRNGAPSPREKRPHRRRSRGHAFQAERYADAPDRAVRRFRHVRDHAAGHAGVFDQLGDGGPRVRRSRGRQARTLFRRAARSSRGRARDGAYRRESRRLRRGQLYPRRQTAGTEPFRHHSSRGDPDGR